MPQSPRCSGLHACHFPTRKTIVLQIRQSQLSHFCCHPNQKINFTGSLLSHLFHLQPAQVSLPLIEKKKWKENIQHICFLQEKIFFALFIRWVISQTQNEIYMLRILTKLQIYPVMVVYLQKKDYNYQFPIFTPLCSVIHCSSHQKVCLFFHSLNLGCFDQQNETEGTLCQQQENGYTLLS